MYRQNRKILAVFFAFFLSVSALAFMTVNQYYVAAPALACGILMIWFWMTLWNRDHKIPFFDVGVFCALATFVYTVYPLIIYWVNGFQFGPLIDSRLNFYNITPAELGLFHLRHVLYLFSFIVFYSAFRGKGNIEVGNVISPSRNGRHVTIIFFILLTGCLFLLQLMIIANPTTNYGVGAYTKNLSALASFPLFLLQISRKLAGILFVFKLALLFIAVSRCRQKKWFIILLLWIAAEIIQAVYVKGSRTELVLFLMATALFYHRMIRLLTMKFLFISGLILLASFIFLGVYRSYSSVAEMQAHLSLPSTGILSMGNEFTALLGTAYDVNQQKAAGAYLPWYLYINDFISILPPQQIMPFEKVPASEWYLRMIGFSGTGLGFMWGVITQCIVGWDWLEIILRGAILGYILARLHRWYLKHQTEFLATLVYTFLCVKVYYTFRDTTGSLLTNLVWEIVPFYLVLCIGMVILSIKINRGHSCIRPKSKVAQNDLSGQK
jgi:hypothetical protein